MNGSNGTTPAPSFPASVGSIPEELRALTQWVGWKAAQRGGKSTKIPLIAGTDPARNASITNPETWRDVSTARAASAQIGFVFTASDPYFGIDLDHCLHDGVLADWAQQIMAHFPGAYMELSPSGSGLHIIGQGVVGGGHRRTLDDGGVLEVYDRERYFTVTGEIFGAAVSTIADCEEGLDWLLATYFADRSGKPATLTVSAVADLDVTLDPDADPPFDKLERLRESHDQWEPTWTMKRRMPKDQSPSAYEQSLCDMMASYDWSPQEMADTLMTFRRKHGFKAKHAKYYRDTITHGLQYAKDQATPKAGAPTADHRAWLNAQPLFAGLEIQRVRKLGQQQGEYQLLLANDVVVELGTAVDVLNPVRVQAAIFDVTGRAVQIPKRATWADYATHIGQAAEVEAAESSPTDALKIWLAAWTSSYPCGHRAATVTLNKPLELEAEWGVKTGELFGVDEEAPKVLLSTGYFWTDEPRLVLRLQAFLSYLAEYAPAQHMTTRECSRNLKRLGFTSTVWRHTFSQGEVRRKRLWTSPVGFDPED